MNAANEVAVQAFLDKQIPFPEIFRMISHVMARYTCIDNPGLSGIIEADQWTRDLALSRIPN